MRNWNSPDDLMFLRKVFVLLESKRVLEPKAFGDAAQLDLRGLTFPTVTQLEIQGRQSSVVRRVAGKLQFEEATLRDVDLSKARLDFSVWNHCVFERVCFDRASLQQCRFFGCRFINCSFRGANFRDASFSIGRGGLETEFTGTVFEKCDLRGATCSNPILRATSFLNCKLPGFVFDGALCDDVTFEGNYKELTFRGLPGDSLRNRLHVDLSRAHLMWLNANFGIDLEPVVLPSDDSCFIIRDRIHTISLMCSGLQQEAGPARKIANVLSALYSDRALSPLDRTQDTLLISRAMLADFAETEDAGTVESVFDLLRNFCRSKGLLVK